MSEPTDVGVYFVPCSHTVFPSDKCPLCTIATQQATIEKLEGKLLTLEYLKAHPGTVQRKVIALQTQLDRLANPDEAVAKAAMEAVDEEQWFEGDFHETVNLVVKAMLEASQEKPG